MRTHLCALLFCLALPLAAAPLYHPSGRHVPDAAFTRQPLGPVEEGRLIHLSLGLASRDAQGLARRLEQVYEPGNTLFHRWLKPEEFGELYGTSASDYQAVLDWAAAHHLQVRHIYQSRLLVSLEGQAQDVGQAFHVQLLRYQHPAGGEFYAPDQEPSTDLAVPLTNIGGLSNLGNRLRKHIHRDLKALRPAAGTGYGSNYLGSDLRKVYLNNTSLDGSGQTMALAEFDDYYGTDISNYAAADGISVPTITKVLVDESAVKTPGDGEDEVALDIEMMMGIAPKASILVYEAPASTNNYNNYTYTVSPEVDVLAKIADDDKAQSISCSWSWDPSSSVDSATAQVFQQYALQGQAFFQAAGDLGAYDSYSPWTNGAAPQPINDSVLMTVVGGTTLTTSGSVYGSETTWNLSPGIIATRTPAPNAVSGGGIVALLAIPTWQVPFAKGSASTSQRNTPDVCLVGDNLRGSADDGIWYLFSGTSAAAPLWAAFAALVNQQAASQGLGPSGFLNPTLYSLALNSATYAADFHDIADGSNNDYWGNRTSQHTAVTGYDLATGLGSIQAPLLASLAGLAPTYTPTRSPTRSPSFTRTVTPTRTITVTPSISPTGPPFLYTGAGHLLLAPVPVRHGGPWQLFCDKQPVSSRWRIYDIAGELVAAPEFNGALASYSTGRLAPGVYLVHLDVDFEDGSKRSAWQKVAVIR